MIIFRLHSKRMLAAINRKNKFRTIAYKIEKIDGEERYLRTITAPQMK